MRDPPLDEAISLSGKVQRALGVLIGSTRIQSEVKFMIRSLEEPLMRVRQNIYRIIMNDHSHSGNSGKSGNSCIHVFTGDLGI